MTTAANVPASLAALIHQLLHEMGQPLTTLQGCRLLPLLAPADRDTLAAEMANEVERITGLYRELRLLLAAILPTDPATNSVVLHEHLHDAAAEWARQADRQQVRLRLDLPSPQQSAAAVTLRAAHAIRCVIAAALGNAPAGSELCVSAAVQPRPGTHRPTIDLAVAINQPGPERTSGLPPTIEVPLRVATTLLQAEGGRMVYNLQPFRATIELPGTETPPSR